MKPFSQLAPLALMLISASVSAQHGPQRLLTLSAQQAERVLAALTSDASDRSQLPSPPTIRIEDIAHITASTGIHRIYPNSEEDYYAFNAMVGKRFYNFKFTITPKSSSTAKPRDLAALLDNGRVTQYDVAYMEPINANTRTPVACRSRDEHAGCDKAR